MKTKLLVVLIPFTLLLSSCGLGGGNDQGAEDLKRACELVNARDSSDEFTPEVAIQFFASAARANVDYLPLVAAAKLSQLPPYDFGRTTALTAEVLKARSLITGYCTPRVAE